MNKLKIFLVFLLSIIIQIAIIPNFRIFNVTANMTIAFIVAVAMNFGSYFAGYSAIVMGLIEDMLFSQVIGIKALIYYIIGFLVGYNEDSINKGDIRSGCIITAIATVFYWILNTIIYMIIGNFNYLTIFSYFKSSIIIEIILNILLYIASHYLLKKIFKKKKFRF